MADSVDDSVAAVDAAKSSTSNLGPAIPPKLPPMSRAEVAAAKAAEQFDIRDQLKESPSAYPEPQVNNGRLLYKQKQALLRARFTEYADRAVVSMPGPNDTFTELRRKKRLIMQQMPPHEQTNAIYDNVLDPIRNMVRSRFIDDDRVAFFTRPIELKNVSGKSTKKKKHKFVRKQQQSEVGGRRPAAARKRHKKLLVVQPSRQNFPPFTDEDLNSRPKSPPSTATLRRRKRYMTVIERFSLRDEPIKRMCATLLKDGYQNTFAALYEQMKRQRAMKVDYGHLIEELNKMPPLETDKHLMFQMATDLCKIEAADREGHSQLAYRLATAAEENIKRHVASVCGDGEDSIMAAGDAAGIVGDGGDSEEQNNALASQQRRYVTYAWLIDKFSEIRVQMAMKVVSDDGWSASSSAYDYGRALEARGDLHKAAEYYNILCNASAYRSWLTDDDNVAKGETIDDGAPKKKKKTTKNLFRAACEALQRIYSQMAQEAKTHEESMEFCKMAKRCAMDSESASLMAKANIALAACHLRCDDYEAAHAVASSIMDDAAAMAADEYNIIVNDPLFDQEEYNEAMLDAIKIRALVAELRLRYAEACSHWQQFFEKVEARNDHTGVFVYHIAMTRLLTKQNRAGDAAAHIAKAQRLVTRTPLFHRNTGYLPYEQLAAKVYAIVQGTAHIAPLVRAATESGAGDAGENSKNDEKSVFSDLVLCRHIGCIPVEELMGRPPQVQLTAARSTAASSVKIKSKLLQALSPATAAASDAALAPPSSSKVEEKYITDRMMEFYAHSRPIPRKASIDNTHLFHAQLQQQLNRNVNPDGEVQEGGENFGQSNSRRNSKSQQKKLREQAELERVNENARAAKSHKSIVSILAKPAGAANVPSTHSHGTTVTIEDNKKNVGNDLSTSAAGASRKQSRAMLIRRQSQAALAHASTIDAALSHTNHKSAAEKQRPKDTNSKLP